MASRGFAEITLIVIAVFVGLAVCAGAASVLSQRRLPPAVARANLIGIARTAVSVTAALAAFTGAVLIHIANPLLESVPFVLGLLLSAAVGIGVFGVMPAPSIDGPMQRRVASVTPRRLSDYSTSAQRAAFASIAVATAAVALLGGLLSKPADDGRWLCPSVFADPCPASGPYLFPGWLFAAPALLLVALLTLAVRRALRRVVDSPATAWPELSDTDTALRRGAVRLVLRIANAALLLSTAMFLGIAALPLLNAPLLDTGSPPETARMLGLIGTVLVGVTVTVFVSGMVVSVLAVSTLVRLPRADESRREQAAR